MIHNSEFLKFTKVYWVAVMVILTASYIFSSMLLMHMEYGKRAEIIVFSAFLSGFLFLVMVILYIIAAFFFSHVYRQVREMSVRIQESMERGEYISLVTYEEGDFGILESNFDKMVKALYIAKEKEHNEKHFLREMISDISHQLKTPLSSLTVFLDLLLEDKLPNREEEKRVLAESRNQLDRMEWMVLSMLKLARIEAGAILFDCKDTDLRQMLLECVECLRVRYENKQQRVSVECEPGIILSLDAEWTREAIVNIIKNAIDYTPQGGSIRIWEEHNRIYQRIFIEDTGMGISEKDISHIFDRFKKGSNNVNSNSVGIGLALSKSIIEGQRGKVHVDSEVGEYTRFQITFGK